MQRRTFALALPGFALAGCAGIPHLEPVHVQLVGLEPAAGEGLELRFLCKLRVQNPNDRSFDYRGVSMELRLQGNAVATGVTDVAGTLPAFGETVILLPVTLSAMSVARTVIDMIMSNNTQGIEYALRGKLGTTFGSIPFESRGAVDLTGGERT